MLENTGIGSRERASTSSTRPFLDQHEGGFRFIFRVPRLLVVSSRLGSPPPAPQRRSFLGKEGLRWKERTLADKNFRNTVTALPPRGHGSYLRMLFHSPRSLSPVAVSSVAVVRGRAL